MSISINDIADRDTFLAFRAAWRTAYAAASQDVRDVKRDMRRLVADRRSGALTADVVDGRMSGKQYDRHLARASARELMELLDEAKERRTALLAARDEAAAAAA
jgi:hypothetical protein